MGSKIAELDFDTLPKQKETTTMSKLKTNRSPAALAVGAAIWALGNAAAADPVVLSANSIASAGGSNATTISSSYSGYEGSRASLSNALGNGSAYSFSNVGGAYAVRSDASGEASGRAAASFAQLLTNTSGMTQHYTMSFHIYGGYMSSYLNGSALLTGTEFLTASYLADISVNGNNVFHSAATIRRDAVGTSGSTEGTVLNAFDDVTDGNYSWGGDYFTVDLGTVLDGGTINVVASLSNESASNVGTYVFDDGGSGYGCYGQTGATGGGRDGNSTAAYGGDASFFKGRANAFYGDPIDFNSSNDTTPGPAGGLFVLNAVNDVPEPSMFGLAFLALGAAGWAGRRRRA